MTKLIKGLSVLIILGVCMVTLLFSENINETNQNIETNNQNYQGINNQDIISQGGENLEFYPDLKVEIFTTQSGQRGWKVKLQRELPLATPAIADNKVYLGGGFGSYEFYTLDAENGKPLWLFHCGDDGPTAAVVAKGKVAFNTESCILYILDTKTGKKLWSKWLGDPLLSQPAIKDDCIVIAYPNNKGNHSLSCMNLVDGTLLWSHSIPGEVISAPIIDKNIVYAATLEGSVHSFNLTTGKHLYTEKHQATAAPWIWKDEVYLSVREDEEEVIDNKVKTIRNEGQARLTNSGKRDNEELWAKQNAEYLNVDNNSEYTNQQSELDASVGFAIAPGTAKLEQSTLNMGVNSVSGVWAYQGSRPTIVNGISYSAMNNVVRAMEAESGKIIWEYQIKINEYPGGRALSPPAYANGKLYLSAASGEIICLFAIDGTELWRFDCGEPVHFQPAIAYGKIYWGTDRGTVYCLDAKDPLATGWYMWGGNAQHNYNCN